MRHALQAVCSEGLPHWQLSKIQCRATHWNCCCSSSHPPAGFLSLCRSTCRHAGSSSVSVPGALVYTLTFASLTRRRIKQAASAEATPCPNKRKLTQRAVVRVCSVLKCICAYACKCPSTCSLLRLAVLLFARILHSRVHTMHTMHSVPCLVMALPCPTCPITPGSRPTAPHP